MHLGYPKKLKNQKGNLTLLSLIVVTALFGVFLFVLNWLPVLHQQRNQSQGLVEQSLALSSVLEYVKYAVRERLCVQPGSLLADRLVGPRGCSTDLEQWANDPKNLERLILSPATLSAEIEGLNVRLGRDPGDRALLLGDGEDYILKVDKALIGAADHPLNIILKSLEGYSGVQISIQRVHNQSLPSNGLSTYLKMRADLVDDSFSIAGAQAFAETLVGYHPRELNSYALVVPGSIRLDLQRASAASPHDFVIPKPNAARLSEKSGVYIAGPVYANENLVLPRRGSGFNPTSFGGGVVLGSGRIMESDGSVRDKLSLWGPASAGGLGDRFLAQLNAQFGGVGGGGVQTRGRVDEGLVYLFDVKPGSEPISADSALQCAVTNQSLVDLEVTKDSQHVIRTLGSPDPKRVMPDGSARSYPFQVGLTRNNRIMPQIGISTGVVSGPSNSSKIDSVTVKSSGSGEAPVLKATIEGKSGDSVEVLLGRNADEVVVEFDPLTDSEIQSIVQNIGTPGLGGGLSAEAQAVASQLQDVRPKLTIRVSNHQVGGKVQSHVMNVEFITENEFAFKKSRAPEVRIELFEVGDDGFGKSLRTSKSGKIPDTKLQDEKIQYTFRMRDSNPYDRHLDVDAAGVFAEFRAKPSSGLKSASDPPDPSQDVESLVDNCSNVAAGSVVAEIEESFATKAKDSWHFSPVDSNEPSLVKDYIFHSGNAKKNSVAVGGPDYRWPVKSLVNQCIIRTSADFVVGFYNCQRLVIESRTDPLTMIGSFIVGSTQIHPSAVINGIKIYSVFHPDAINQLREQAILGKGTAGDCQRQLDPSRPNFEPVWHPEPSLTSLSLYYACFPSALRAAADPWQWTRVDPDCARPDADSIFTQCKRRPKEFVVESISYLDNLQ